MGISVSDWSGTHPLWGTRRCAHLPAGRSRVSFDTSCQQGGMLAFTRSIVLDVWKGRLVRRRGCRWRGCFIAWKRIKGCRRMGCILARTAVFMIVESENKVLAMLLLKSRAATWKDVALTFESFGCWSSPIIDRQCKAWSSCLASSIASLQRRFLYALLKERCLVPLAQQDALRTILQAQS